MQFNDIRLALQELDRALAKVICLAEEIYGATRIEVRIIELGGVVSNEQ